MAKQLAVSNLTDISRSWPQDKVCQSISTWHTAILATHYLTVPGDTDRVGSFEIILNDNATT